MMTFIRVYRFKRGHGWNVLNALRAARDAVAQQRRPL
jgi:hypothetical protein